MSGSSGCVQRKPEVHSTLPPDDCRHEPNGPHPHQTGSDPDELSTGKCCSARREAKRNGERTSSTSRVQGRKKACIIKYGCGAFFIVIDRVILVAKCKSPRPCASQRWSVWCCNIRNSICAGNSIFQTFIIALSGESCSHGDGDRVTAKAKHFQPPAHRTHRLRKVHPSRW